MQIFILLFVLFLVLFIVQKKKNKRLSTEKKQLEEGIFQEKQSELANLNQQLSNVRAQYSQEKMVYDRELSFIRGELAQFQEKRKAVNEAILREREVKEKEKFYSISLTLNDIEDIEMLNSLAPKLRHKELIPKLVWDSIVSRPTTEMIKRVVGTKVGGIYKITYAPTGESYIGRTVNFKDRWKNHIQTALGIDKVAKTTLHVHMAQHGLQNYRFEILEECAKEIQGEREKFYIDLYGTQGQLNMRAGG